MKILHNIACILHFRLTIHSFLGYNNHFSIKIGLSNYDSIHLFCIFGNQL